jgi:hypothetical protein
LLPPRLGEVAHAHNKQAIPSKNQFLFNFLINNLLSLIG